LDLGILGHITLYWDFVFGFISIIIINIILSGDNAVVIALAVRSLPRKQRLRGIAFGSSLAVVLRVILTFFAARLLEIQFVKFIGGALIAWIAAKLLVEGTAEEDSYKEAKTIWQAIWVILVADLTMSLDNVLGVAAASKGNLFLLIFGLGLSIPIVVFTSNLLSRLMDRYPFLVYVGAAILGRVAGEMMITDPWIINFIQPSKFLQYNVQIFFTIGVLVAGKIWIKWQVATEKRLIEPLSLKETPKLAKEEQPSVAILTLSREYQNGSPEIGQAVADRLGYAFVDSQCIYTDLSAVGEKWGKLAQELDEVRPYLWEKYDREYQGFIALIESTIYEYAAKGRAVILGRGSAFLLHDIPHVLKVRLFAPLEVRIERVMLRNKVDRETAEELIERTDKSRAGYVQAIYGKPLKDTENYDLVFNTGIQTYEQITQELLDTLKQWEQRITPEGLQRLKDRALAAKVKAQILTHPGLFIHSLEVFHDGVSIVLKGLVHSPKDYQLVEEIAHKIADPHSILNGLKYRG
jgi:YjbE family integral membrane protein